MAYLLKKTKKIRTDGQTDKRTDGQTNGRSDYIIPQILKFGGIKINLQEPQRNHKYCKFNKDQYCITI